MNWKICNFAGLLIGFLSVEGCAGSPLQNTDPRLSMSQGRWLFEGKPYNGTITEFLPGATRVTAYKEGIEEGDQVVTGDAGQIIEQRSYKSGKKHGRHYGWFPDGKDRFYTEFTDDHYSGEHWTWHANGKVAEFKKYTPDGQILVHKHWRESGQIYRNQVFAVNNTEVGMPGVKLCNTVKTTVGGR